ncbi:MAG TPA: radical SAM protein [Patescibacteria group bacterium]|nr:radical SAM protein [Patescibacteria group bacterium]
MEEKQSQMSQKAPLPVDAVIGITYNCNSRCVMCDIWKMDPHELLKVEDLKKLPLTLKDVNISGGEPFLHKDIVAMVKTVRERLPKARIVISSNGFATELIKKRIKEIVHSVPDIRVAISIDGMQQVHDETRKIPDGFNKCMATIDMLKQVGVKSIRIAFTVMTHNIAELPKVYDLAQEKGIEFTMAFAQSSDFYFGSKQNYEHPDPELLKKGFEHVIVSELQSWHPKRWARAFFAYGLYQFAISQEQPLPSHPGTDFFYLDPNGYVYPSVIHFYKMGDIKQVHTFEEMWHGEQAESARKKVKESKRQYWMICTARTAIKRHPLYVIGWIMKNKFSSSALLSA